MSSKAVIVYEHVDHPEWGRGVVDPTPGRDDRLDLAFERGGRRVILKRFSFKLMPIILPTAEAVSLGASLLKRREAALRAGARKPGAPKVVSAFTSFESQLAAFLEVFPDGFMGEAFVTGERGAPDAKRKKTDTGAAIPDAQAALSPEAFETKSTDEIFAEVSRLLRTTAFVHPLEGATSLETMKDEDRGNFVEALRALLHGEGDEAERFNAWVDAIRIEDAKGSPRRPTWPLTTMLQAIVHPETHICIKPTYFQRQATVMNVPLGYEPRPEHSIYARFLDTARKTQAALEAAGQTPRDLVDVASFICRTQATKPAK